MKSKGKTESKRSMVVQCYNCGARFDVGDKHNCPSTQEISMTLKIILESWMREVTSILIAQPDRVIPPECKESLASLMDRYIEGSAKHKRPQYPLMLELKDSTGKRVGEVILPAPDMQLF